MATETEPSIRDAERIARRRLGFDSLHPGQEAAIAALLAGHDTLAVLPTGSGKSAIYQIASALLPGPTVIISPLIALQRDQVQSIEASDLGSAAAVNSNESEGEREEIIEEFEGHDVDYLFLAPEQLSNEEIIADLKAAKPSLFVVDEAHAISEWGHDFRPEYLRLGGVIDAIGHPRVLALTATAAPAVRGEIVERLHMRDPEIVVRGFDRPNIWLGVERFHDERRKTEALLERVQEAEKPGIVYVATKKHAEGLDEKLRAMGITSVHYHAGMSAKARKAAQDAFMEGTAEVMVATIAFGMGIDKEDVRFVFHHDISDSIDSYYQEIGRAGRDGQEARAILFYRPEDLGLHRFFAGGGKIATADVEKVVDVVAGAKEPLSPAEIHQRSGLSLAKTNAATTRLSDIGVLTIGTTGEITAGQAEISPSEATAKAVAADEHHHAFERSRIEMMRGYAELYDCRREYILNYFGEAFEPPCCNCDNCQAGIYTRQEPGSRPFPLGSRVTHKSLGPGIVERYEGNDIVVVFDESGYKTLDLDFVQEYNVLQAK